MFGLELKAMNIVSSKSLLFIISKLVQFIYSFYDKILISSNSFKETIQNRYSKEIIYFPNWAEKEIEENIRTKNINIIIPKNKFVIMYTGNIGAAQNLISLISAIKELQNEKIIWVFCWWR